MNKHFCLGVLMGGYFALGAVVGLVMLMVCPADKLMPLAIFAWACAFIAALCRYMYISLKKDIEEGP